jgi:hypothetical protein
MHKVEANLGSFVDYMASEYLRVEVISSPDDVIRGVCMITLSELLNCSVAGKCFDAPVYAVTLNDRWEIEVCDRTIASLRFRSTMWCEAS